MSGAADRVQRLLDHLFRREAGRMIAGLTRSFGPAHLQLAEEVVQEALLQALRRWPFHGVPDNPSAWLYRVARNRALDRLRRDASLRDKETAIREALRAPSAADHAGQVFLPGELSDDQLRLMFLCCHPELPRDARVALTLKTVVGFSVAEIARAFLAREPTVAQRLVRAQRRIRRLGLPFELPEPALLPRRLDAVLEVLYLTFNEGYASRHGDALVRQDLCEESLRLVGLLCLSPETDRPVTHALAALLNFQAARLPARVDDEGSLVLLADQDRSLWDAARVSRAFVHLDRAASGAQLTDYHLQAAIAARHASAPGDGETDWPAILELFDDLLARNASPVVALNRAVVLARVHGPRAGLAALARIADDPVMGDYYLLAATRGTLLEQVGDVGEAARWYRRALECGCSDPARRFLQRKIRRLDGR